MTRTLLSVLPLACVMVAGPQIISAIFLATSPGWARDSAAYLGGAVISITLVVSFTYLITRLAGAAAGTAHHTQVQNGIDIGVAVLLVILAVGTFRKRAESEPPRWMGKLENATGRLSFVLGFLLLGFFPADLLTSIAVGAHLGGHADPWWHAGLFVLVTLFLLAIPALLVLVLGKRAAAVLPAIRDWLNGNAWLVSEAVIAFFLALTIMSLTGGLAPDVPTLHRAETKPSRTGQSACR